MQPIDHNQSPEVAAVFDRYPTDIRYALWQLRRLILEAAADNEGIDTLEETLKWGEPSYLAKQGSTIRLGWKQAKPDQYALHFHCQTCLVETFKECYRDVFRYDGNRAIIFQKGDEIPVDELKHCITLSLTYHRIKHLQMLGIQ